MAVDAGSVYSEIRILLDKLKGDVLKVTAEFDKIGATSQTTATKTQTNFTKSFQAINIAGIAAFAAITLAVKKAIGVFGDFEQSLANTQSVARATPADFEKLEAAALRAGETTRFTAAQAADALYYLASAGLSAQESVEALSGVLELAGATQSDLAFTSATMTAAIAQFGLETRDSSRVANVFAAAIAGSQANMEKLSTSMKYVGPVAAGFNMSIEQTVGILEGLYNAGFQGEQAGAALRNVLADLSDQSGPVVRRLQELGFAFEDISPITNDFATIIDNLNERGIDVAETMSAFGKRSGPIMATLLRQGGDSIRDFTNEITGTNAATEAYAIQNDTLQGSLDRFKSALESAAIRTLQELNPIIRGIVDIGTKLLEMFNGLPGPIKVLIATLAIGIPIISGIAAAFSALAGIIAAVSGPVTLVVGGIALLTAGIVALMGVTDRSITLQKNLRTATDNLRKSINDYEENQKQLKKAISEGNQVEAQTLKIRQDILKNQIALNLKSTIDNISALTREEGKQNTELEKRRKYLNTVQKEIDGYNRSLKEQYMTGYKNNEFTRHYEGLIKEISVTLADAKKKYDQQTLAINENKLAREEAINILSEQLNAGQIELVQISAVDKGVAELVLTKSKQLKEQKALNDATGKGTAAGEDNVDGINDLIDANTKLTESTKKLREQLEDLKATDIEQLELEKKRAIETAKNSNAEKQFIDENIKAINNLYNAKIEKLKADQQEEESRKRLQTLEEKRNATLERIKAANEAAKDAIIKRAEEIKNANENAIKTTEDYEQKLKDMIATEYEAIELQRQRAIETVRAASVTAELTEEENKAIIAINKYYDALRDTTAADIFSDRMKRLFDDVISGISSMFGIFGELSRAQTNERIAELDKQLQAELEAAGLLEETTVDRLKREIEEAKAAGDIELAAEKEKELQREQITSEFERKKAQIQYKAALAEWNLKKLALLMDTAVAIGKAVASAPLPWNLPAIGFATAQGIAQAVILEKAKPEAPSFQTGGIVLPSGRREGRSVNVAEGGSTEMLFNDSAAGMPFIEKFAEILSSKISSGQAGAQFTVVIVNSDMTEQSRHTVNLLNNGVLQITTRGIKQ